MNYLLLILPAATIAAIVIELCTIPARIRKMEKQIGTCQLELSRKTSPMFIGGVAVALILPCVMIFRPFEPLYTAILCGCAVLGVEVVIRERVYEARNGVYENALIVDGRYFPKDDVITFPELHYEKDNDEEEEVDELYRRALKIVSKKSGEVYVGFANGDEKDAAVELLKDW